MRFTFSTFVLTIIFLSGALGQDPSPLADHRIVFLGDSITQDGRYVGYLTYYLEKAHVNQHFDILDLGLASETLSGLSEEGHAGGSFARPWLFERLGQLLDRAKPKTVFACYGMNDGIYRSLEKVRFAAFQSGVNKLIEQCQAAGVQQLYLITPPIYDEVSAKNEFNYDSVLTEYARWEMSLNKKGVVVVDLHTAMRKARSGRAEPFSRDRVHPGDDGHLLIARTILDALRVKTPKDDLASIKADPLYKLIEQQRVLRSEAWMKHIGYTREKTVAPGPLGDVEKEVARLQERIDELRRKP